jgi:hypothetical protein
VPCWAAPWLQELVLEDVTAPGAQCEKLLTALGPDLQTLRMCRCSLDNTAAAAFTSLRGLRSLALVDCQILPAEMLQLTALSMLTHLVLCGKFKRRLQKRRSGSSMYELDLYADPKVCWPGSTVVGARLGSCCTCLNNHVDSLTFVRCNTCMIINH